MNHQYARSQMPPTCRQYPGRHAVAERRNPGFAVFFEQITGHGLALIGGQEQKQERFWTAGGFDRVMISPSAVGQSRA